MFVDANPTDDQPAAPQQTRSREKLERILAATETLLDVELFEDLTIARIAAEAGVSVGTVYTRFRAKEDLLPVLFARHDAAVAGRVRKLLQATAREAALRARIERLVGFAVDYHRRHRGLLRALTMYVRAHPDGIPGRAFADRAAQYRAVAEILVGDGGELRAENVDAAIADAEFGLGVVNSVCREQVLFDDVTPLRSRRRSLAALKRRLADLLQRD